MAPADINMRHDLLRKSLSLLIILLITGTGIIPASAVIVSKDVAVLFNKQTYSSPDFDDNITLLIKQVRIPSLSACIVKNDRVVWYKGYGFYNMLLRKKPSSNTVYMAGSISKAITAMALMQLYEKGLFDLDDDVSDYLPFVLRNPNYPGVPVIFKMFMSHQSSLSMIPLKRYPRLGLAYLLNFPKLSYPNFEEYLVPSGRAYHPDVWTENMPGETFNYSNVGYMFLEYLVELISGQSFKDYCKEHIFIPLKMFNTSFDFHNFKRKNRAVPYMQIGNLVCRLPYYNLPAPGAGGLLTSIDDISHFLIAHMNGGMYQDVRVLNESSIELIHTLHYYHNYSKYVNYQYGLGWMFFNESGTIYQGHDGDTFGYAARMKYRESDKTGVIFFVNYSPLPKDEEQRQACLEIYELIFQELFSKADEL